MIIALCLGIVGVYFLLGLDELVTLDKLKAQMGILPEYVMQSPVSAAALFFMAYVVLTTLSLPGAAIMTMAGGALFGFAWGLALTSFASTIGATLAFIVARALFGERVAKRFGAQLEVVNTGLAREGNFYLFSIRMVPLFPFFLVNLVMSLTKIRVVPFYLVSQAGMLMGTSVFVFAGTELAKLSSVSDVLSPGLILALSLLGVFPLLTKRVMIYLSHRRL